VLPGHLTPRLQERLGRLGTWMPCAPAAEAWAVVTGVTISAATVRRTTEGAGAADEAVQTTEVAAIEPQLPAVPPGPRVQLLSVDGAMGPLRQQAWAEVKTLAIGPVGGPVRERGDGGCRRRSGRIVRVWPLRRPSDGWPW
jgi:hypothetical protein